MAAATKRAEVKEVSRTIVTKVTDVAAVPAGVTLELTQTEAEVLLRIVYGAVTGTLNSPRKYTDRIGDALMEAGVAYEKDHYKTDGTLIRFEDYPKVPRKVQPKAPEVFPTGSAVAPSEDWSITPVVGDTCVIVDSPYIGLKVGDEVVITSTTKRASTGWDCIAKPSKRVVGTTLDEYGFNAKHLKVVTLKVQEVIAKASKFASVGEVKVGDRIQVGGVSGEGVYTAGDKGVVVDVSEDGDLLTVDFNHQGNPHVVEDGIWFVSVQTKKITVLETTK